MTRLVVVALVVGFVAMSLGPFSTDAPKYPFVNNHLKQPTSLWGSQFKAPYETNAFFQNLVLGTGFNPINLFPYIIEVDSATQGLGIGVPTSRVSSDKSVLTPYVRDWALGVVEGGFDGHKIVAADKLSVTMDYTKGSGKMSAPLVHGMGMVSGIFESLTPYLKTDHSILSVQLTDGSSHSNGDTLVSNRFIISLNSGRYWVLYTSEQVTLTFTMNEIKLSSAFTGKLRLAVLGESATAAGIYDQYKDAIPSNGAVDYSFSGDSASITFTYSLLSLSSDGPSNGDALMYALPHHVDILQGAKTENIQFQTIKGKITAVCGNTWTMNENLTPITWDAPRDYTSNDWKEAVRSALGSDYTYKATAGDPYFFGTQVGRMARLALIADSLGETDKANTVRSNIKSVLVPWLENSNSDPLKYDQTWGGLCSNAGLNDGGADFGNGLYNDHHFHYGYHVYAAAVVGKADPSFLEQYKSQIITYVRDYANPSTQDPYFPVTRNKDWYNGHSWASGVTEFGDNRNQESTSEAINAYYSIVLLGEAMNDQNMKDWGRLLLAMEIRSAKKYWHVKDDSIYPDDFVGGHMVGVLWDTKVDYATWFGGNVEYIHGIQMLPFTPITEESLDPSFVSVEYNVVANAGSQEWLSYMIMDEAVIDANTAWGKLNSAAISNWAGNSKTNALWWIATRPAASDIELE